MQANRLRPGNVIEHEGKIWQCLEAVHKTPGNKRAFVQAKMRNVQDGTQKEFKFSATDGLDQVSLRKRTMQYLYNEGDLFHFMDTENYEQIHLGKEMLGHFVSYLLPDAQVSVTFYEQTPIGLDFPQKMEFQVIEADPAMRTATATASLKNAKIETGKSVKVPQFIESGDRIIIDTTNGAYVERAKK